MSAIKACPFCGEENNIYLVKPRGQYYSMECGKCEAEGPATDSPESATELWNYRVYDFNEIKMNIIDKAQWGELEDQEMRKVFAEFGK